MNKLSITIPDTLTHFIEEYQQKHGCQNRSEVIRLALKTLQQHELEQAYHAANDEIDPAYEITSSDGLTDEMW